MSRDTLRDAGYFAGCGIFRGIRDTARDTGYFAGYGILRGIRDTSRDTGYFPGISRDTSADLGILKRILRPI